MTAAKSGWWARVVFWVFAFPELKRGLADFMKDPSVVNRKISHWTFLRKEKPHL